MDPEQYPLMLRLECLKLVLQYPAAFVGDKSSDVVMSAETLWRFVSGDDSTDD